MRGGTLLVSILLLCYKIFLQNNYHDFFQYTNIHASFYIYVQKHMSMYIFLFMHKNSGGDYFIRGVNISLWNIHPGVKISWGWIFNPTPVVMRIAHMSFSKWPPGGHIGFFSFRILTLVWLWISSPNFSSKLLVCMERSLLIFSNVTFKMAAWLPHWILTSGWLWTLNPNLRSTLPMCMDRWKHSDFEQCLVTIHALPTATPPAGQGILVDHWSTISSLHYQAIWYILYNMNSAL